MTSQLSISAGTLNELPALEAVHRAAFPTDLEARLVRLLFRRGKAIVSLKAVVDDQTVGHVLFSPATCDIVPSDRPGGGLSLSDSLPSGLGLAPLAVIPAYQRQGVGSALVRAGIEACSQLGAAWIIVLGDPAFYSRFGFEAASRYAITGEFGGGDAFQMLILDANQLPPAGRSACYSPEFRELIGDQALPPEI